MKLGLELFLLVIFTTAVPTFSQISALRKFFFNRPSVTATIPPPTTLLGCRLSGWSQWGVKAFGGMERHRMVLDSPTSSKGRSCLKKAASLDTASLVQHKPGPKPTLEQTKNSFKNYFLRREDQTCRDFKVCTRALKAATRKQQSMVRDMVIIVDSSGSIGQRNFDRAKGNIADLMSMLCPRVGTTDPFKSSSTDYHQAGLINYAATVVEKWDFNDKHPTSALTSAIRSLRYRTGGTGRTCTNNAFKKAISMFTSGIKGLRNHPNVKREVLIVTDGLSNCGGSGAAIRAAKDLRNHAEVYALLIGKYNGRGQKEARQYVSQPVGNHLFNVPTFEDLNKLVTELKSAAQPCYHLQ